MIPEPRPSPGRHAGRYPTVVGDEAVELCADRALYWTRARTLFVADVHLGKAAAFRAGGVPVPRGTTATDLARLTALMRSWQEKLGDEQPLTVKDPKPKEVRFDDFERKPDQWQPAWIVEKYFRDR